MRYDARTGYPVSPPAHQSPVGALSNGAPVPELLHSANPTRSPPALAMHGLGPWLNQVVSLTVIALAILAALTPVAALLRFVFPAVAGLVAAALFFSRRPALYVTFCLWLFILTPFVRRLVDQRSGFTEGSLLMLAPYVAGSIAFLASPTFLFSRTGRGRLAIFVALAVALYGLLVAILYDRILAGAFDFLRWSVPPAIAAYVISNADKREEMYADIRALALIALPLLALYGLYQFVFVPDWDRIWMIGSKMESIGTPEPYQVRTFSMLNSPGSFAFYLVYLSLICLAVSGWSRLGGLVLGIATLLTTLVRAAWLTFGFGAVVLMVVGSGRARLSIVTSLVGAFLLLPLAITSPQVQNAIETRFTSITELTRDKSAADRSQGYQFLLAELEEHVMGQGTGVAGSYQSYGGSAERRTIDGALIEIYLAFGVFAGTAYLAMLALLFFSVFRTHTLDDTGLVAASKAVVGCFTLALISGTMVAGELGMLFWVSCGLVLAQPVISRAGQPEALPHPQSV